MAIQRNSIQFLIQTLAQQQLIGQELLPEATGNFKRNPTLLHPERSIPKIGDFCTAKGLFDGIGPTDPDWRTRLST